MFNTQGNFPPDILRTVPVGQFGYESFAQGSAHSKTGSGNSATTSLSDLSRQKLIELVSTYGTSIIYDRQRCVGLIRDYLGVDKREVNLLIMALKEEIPQSLCAQARKNNVLPVTELQTLNRENGEEPYPKNLILCQCESRLVNNHSITSESARWAIRSWALALDFVTRVDLAEYSNTADSQPVRKELNNRSSAPAKEQPTLTVAKFGGGHFKSLAAVVPVASHGTKIIIKPGHYQETLILDKSIVIVGAGQPGDVVIHAEPSIISSADCLKLENVTVVGSILVEKGQLALKNCQVVGEIKIVGEPAQLVAETCKINKLEINKGGFRLADCDVHILNMSQNSHDDLIMIPTGSAIVEKQQPSQPTRDPVDLLGLIQCLTNAGVDR